MKKQANGKPKTYEITVGDLRDYGVISRLIDLIFSQSRQDIA